MIVIRNTMFYIYIYNNRYIYIYLEVLDLNRFAGCLGKFSSCALGIDISKGVLTFVLEDPLRLVRGILYSLE